MLTDFHAYLNQFCQQRGLSWTQGAEAWQATLNVEGLPLNLGYMEDRGVFFAQSAVGFLPETLEAQHAVMLKVLMANNAFSSTGGTTLGYDKELDCITLQVAWPISSLNGEIFSNVLENFVLITAHFMQELIQEVEVSSPNANDIGRPVEEMSIEALMSTGYGLRI